MRMRFALAGHFVGTFVLGAAASAQAVPKAWDVIVTVQKSRVGGDLVTFGARDASYPPDLLQKQIVALGERLGSPSRVVMVSREAVNALFPPDKVKGKTKSDGEPSDEGGGESTRKRKQARPVRIEASPSRVKILKDPSV